MNQTEDEILEQSFRPATRTARVLLNPRKEILKQTLSELPSQSVTFPKTERLSYQEAKRSLMDTILMNFRTYAPRYAAALVAVIAVVGIIRSYSHSPNDAPAEISQTSAGNTVKNNITANENDHLNTTTPTEKDSIDTLLADMGQESDPAFDSEDAAAEENDSDSDELIISLSETYDEETF